MRTRTIGEMMSSVSPETESLRKEIRDLKTLLHTASLGTGDIQSLVRDVALAIPKETRVQIPKVTPRRGPRKPASIARRGN